MGLAASRQEAFWEACGFGHIGRAKAFLNEGEIDVNWVSYVNDSCPIHVASQGKPEIVDLLIANNCDVNAKDGRGNLAIHHAAMKGHADIVQKLIDAGSEIDTQEKNGWTALHNAAYWCHPDVVHVLLKNKCDVGITNKDERTALHECARSQDTDDCRLAKVAQLLIDAGSDVNAKSSDWGEADLTALMCAAYHNHPEVATALIDAKCDIDAIGSTYWTALHWAADRGNEELVYILVEAGADPTKKDLKGDTALDRASTDNIREVLTTVTRLHKELLTVNSPTIQPVTCLRKPVEPYVPKCDPKFKSQSLLPATWASSTSSNVKNLINEKKSRLAAQTSQTYRQELARRTGTNTITDEEYKKDKSENSDKSTDEKYEKDKAGNSDKLIDDNNSGEKCDKDSEKDGADHEASPSPKDKDKAGNSDIPTDDNHSGEKCDKDSEKEKADHEASPSPKDKDKAENSDIPTDDNCGEKCDSDKTEADQEVSPSSKDKDDILAGTNKVLVECETETISSTKENNDVIVNKEADKVDSDNTSSTEHEGIDRSNTDEEKSEPIVDDK